MLFHIKSVRLSEQVTVLRVFGTREEFQLWVPLVNYKEQENTCRKNTKNTP